MEIENDPTGVFESDVLRSTSIAMLFSATMDDNEHATTAQVLIDDRSLFEEQLLQQISPEENTSISDDLCNDASPSFVRPDKRASLDLCSIKPADEHRQALLHGTEHGYKPLIENILQSISSSAAVRGCDQEDLMCTCYRILLSTDSRIMTAILSGNITQQVKNDRGVEWAFQQQQIRARSIAQPYICVNELADDMGRCPPITLVLNVLRHMEFYLQTNNIDKARLDFILSVDEAFEWRYTTRPSTREEARKGARRYLKNDVGSSARKKRVEILQRFIEKVRKRVSNILGVEEDCLCNFEDLNLDSKLLLEPAFTEVGFTSYIETRLGGHKAHRPSNFIMNLFEATALVLSARRFRIHQYVVYLIWQQSQGTVAEILFTLLANATIVGGSGFSYYDPGILVTAVYQVPPQKWADLARWAIDNSPYVNNDALEKRRIIAAEEAKVAFCREQILILNTEMAWIKEKSGASEEEGTMVPKDTSDLDDALRPLVRWMLLIRALKATAHDDSKDSGNIGQSES